MGKPEAIDVAKSDAVHEEIAPAPSNEATHDPGADSSSDEGGPEKMTRAKWLACIALGLGYTTAFQQLACTGTILRPIDQELGHTPHYNWMMASYTLCSAVFLPLSGGLSDMFGRRWFFMGGCAISFVGTLISAQAVSVNMVIGGMALKGVGSAAQQLAIAAVSEIVPNRHRGTAQAGLDILATPWSMFGALTGNAMVKYHHLSFRINWYLGCALNVATIIMTFFFYHPPSHPHAHGKTKRQQFLELDWVGVGLWAAGLSLFLIGVSFGGVTFPWKSATVIGLLVSGAATLLALGIWEWKFAPNPFMDHRLFSRGRAFSLVLVIVFVGGMGLYAGSAFWPQQISYMYTEDPIKIGLISIAGGGGGALAGFVSGMVIGRHRFLKTNNCIIFGVSLLAIACGVLTTLTPDTLPLAIGITFLSGCGIGWISVGLIVCIQLACDDDNIGLASMLTGSFRSAGGTVALAIYSTVLGNKVKEVIGPTIARAVVPLGVSVADLPRLIGALTNGDIGGAMQIPGVNVEVLLAAKEASKWAYAEGFKYLYFTAMAFALAALVAAFFMRDMSKNMTNHVAVRLENEAKDTESEKTTA